MGTITIKVSDLTGAQIPDDEQAARIIVEHPDFPEPIGLDVLPDEVLPHLTDQQTRFVVVSYQSSEGADPERFVMPIDEFNSLFQDQDSSTVLQRVFDTQQQRGRGRRRGGRRQAQRARERIDWASPEHAGEPHPGTISEAEKAYVRDHLDDVNARLREKGMRELDPTDPETAERYGLTPV
jgi:hypothetical protein